MPAAALEGLRILDLSRVLAGPYCAQMLGDLGADVLKVERPPAGDDTRRWGPPWTGAPDGGRGEATYYLAANRNKRSVAIDFRDPRGACAVAALVARADVVIENYRPGDLARFGLDHETMLARHPALVWCSITGFGHAGPNAARAGYDFMIQAESGLMDITGEEGGRPLRTGVAVADLTTGMMAATAILAALRHRDRTGEGQHIDMALFDVTVGWLANQATGWLMGGHPPRRMGNAHPSIVPYQDFPTATGRIALAVGNDRQFERFAGLVGHPEWSTDPAYASSPARVANRARLVALIEEVLARQPAEHWLPLFAGAGIPAGPVATVAQALASDQARARGLVVEQADPALGTVRTVAQPLALAATPPSYRLPPPAVGQHSRAILREAGLDEAVIATLIADGVVHAP